LEFNLRLILAVLFTFRLAQLFAYDDGPYYVFKRLREWVNSKKDESATWDTIDDLIVCPYCQGLWLAPIAALLYLYPTNVGDIILLIAGIAGGQAWLQMQKR
jgi:hypothetical protein